MGGVSFLHIYSHRKRESRRVFDGLGKGPDEGVQIPRSETYECTSQRRTHLVTVSEKVQMQGAQILRSETYACTSQ